MFSTDIEDSSKNLVYIYESLFSSPLHSVKDQIAALLRTANESFNIEYQWRPMQNDGVLCGLHALANLTEICINKKSWEINKY